MMIAVTVHLLYTVLVVLLMSSSGADDTSSFRKCCSDVRYYDKVT
jgi:hypothetical protein